MKRPSPTFHVLVCSDNSYAGDPELWCHRLERLCSRTWDHGVALWLRETDLAEADYEALARRVLLQTRAAQIPLLLRGHVHMAKRLGVGTHLPSSGTSPKDARELLGESAIIGRSCHSLAECAQSAQCDYITLSPMWPTESKPGQPGIFDQITTIEETSPAVLALGGLRLERALLAASKGFHGIAAQRLIWHAAQPEEMTAKLLAPFPHSRPGPSS